MIKNRQNLSKFSRTPRDIFLSTIPNVSNTPKPFSNITLSPISKYPIFTPIFHLSHHIAYTRPTHTPYLHLRHLPSHYRPLYKIPPPPIFFYTCRTRNYHPENPRGFTRREKSFFFLWNKTTSLISKKVSHGKFNEG